MADFLEKVERKAKKTEKSKKKSIIILIIVVALTLLFALVGFITDWLWFKDLGYTSVFWKRLLTSIEIGIPVLAVCTLLMRFYLRTLKNGYFRKVESHEIPNAHKLNIASWVLSGLFGLIVAWYSANATWLTYLKAANSTDFNLKDPLFGLDVGFYVFKLDWLTQLNSIVIGMIVGMVIVTLIYYTILIAVRTPDIFMKNPEEEAEEEEQEDDTPRFSFDPNVDKGVLIPVMRELFKAIQRFANGERRPRKPKKSLNNQNINHLFDIASGKLTILGVVFYIMLGVHFLLKQFELLHMHNGTVYGAGFVDVNITLWVYRIIMVLSVVGAVTLTMHIKKGEIKKLTKVPVIMACIFLLGGIVGKECSL